MVTHASARGGAGARPLTPIGELEARKLADAHNTLARRHGFSPMISHVASSTRLRCLHTAVEFVAAYPENYNARIPIRTDDRLTEGPEKLTWDDVVTAASATVADAGAGGDDGVALFVHGDLANALSEAGLQGLPPATGGFFDERPILVVAEVSLPSRDARLVAAESTSL